MAGDWIKVEVATLTKPEVLAIAEFLGITKNETLGTLLELFAWYDMHLANGNANGVTRSMIDSILRNANVTQMRGNLSDALLKVGWLRDDSGQLAIPNFERHNGKSAKVRALTNERAKKFRAQKSNANVTPREEKSISLKEKYNERGQSPPDWVPLDAWQAFEEVRAKLRKGLTARARTLAYARLDVLRQAGHDPRAVIEQSVLNGWTGFFEIKAPRGVLGGAVAGLPLADGKINCRGCGARVGEHTDRLCKACWDKR